MMQLIVAIVAVIYFWDEIVEIAHVILLVLQWTAYGLAGLIVIAAIVGLWSFLRHFKNNAELHTVLNERPNTPSQPPSTEQPHLANMGGARYPSVARIATPPPRLATVNPIVTVAIIIDEPWISKILCGEKTWEMRSKPTRKREMVGLVRKGSGHVCAVARISDCRGPLNDAQVVESFEKHRVPLERIGKWRYGYVLDHIVQLPRPVSYTHNKGAVVFVKLGDQTTHAISAQLATL